MHRAEGRPWGANRCARLGNRLGGPRIAAVAAPPRDAKSFVIAGGISCIPAAVAVWALVKPRVFAAYIGYAVLGAMIAGLAWSAWA